MREIPLLTLMLNDGERGSGYSAFLIHSARCVAPRELRWCVQVSASLPLLALLVDVSGKPRYSTLASPLSPPPLCSIYGILQGLRTISDWLDFARLVQRTFMTCSRVYSTGVLMPDYTYCIDAPR